MYKEYKYETLNSLWCSIGAGYMSAFGPWFKNRNA